MDTSESQSTRVIPMVSDELEAISLVLRLSALARVQLSDTLQPLGMSWARFEVLQLLCGRGAMSTGEISTALFRHRTSIKATVANLEDSNFVTRTPDWVNGQKLMVKPTETGQMAHARAAIALTHRQWALPSNVPTADLVELLARVEQSWSSKDSSARHLNHPGFRAASDVG